MKSIKWAIYLEQQLYTEVENLVCLISQILKKVTDFNQPFRAEMLAVYLIREFSVELVEHVAKKKNPEKAVLLNNNIKQHLGIGNSTGLGMAPFIIKHPKLVNKWMKQYSQSLENILDKKINEKKIISYFDLLNKALNYLHEVITYDEYQIKKNTKTIERFSSVY